MNNLFQKILNSIAKHFSEDLSKMLIVTGVIGWLTSSLAQMGGILFNKEISSEQKSFLLPQEFTDALFNIGSFFVITQVTKKSVSKLFTTGKFSPKCVREYLNKKNYSTKIGKLDFNIDDVIASAPIKIKKSYSASKNFYTTLATVIAGIFSSNIVTPIARNKLAANAHKNYLNMKQDEIRKDKTPLQTHNIYKANGMKI